MRRGFSRALFMTLAGLLALAPVAAAQMPQYRWVLPRDSQGASVSQVIGVTDIVIRYHRPAVKGREIWGKVVPFDKVWRTGANEATTISFSTDVKVEGQPLKAGEYALFMLPTVTEWTIIFSRATKQFGAFTYKESDDALRVKVTPQKGEHQELLQFSFPLATLTETQAVLHWERFKVAFTITAETPALAAAKAAQTFNNVSAYYAAEYYFWVEKNYEEALKWASVSALLHEDTANLSLKARSLAALQRYSEALQTGEQALRLMKAEQLPTANFEKLLAEWKTQAK